MATKRIQVALATLLLLQLCAAEQCGRQAGNASCPKPLCCSALGWCGRTPDFCAPGCQSGPCLCETTQNISTSLVSDIRTGEATYYTKFLPSSCYGNDAGQFPANQLFAAGTLGGPNIWNGGHNCGKWFKVRCAGDGCRNSDNISVKIVDSFSTGCLIGPVFHLSDTAFKAIANTALHAITVEYSGPYDSP